MSFELDRKESVPNGIRRIIAEQIEDSLKTLRRKTGTSAEAIHTVRKQLKEVRAALRLVRYEVGEDLFRRENAIFRDATQPLSEVRDADVMTNTLDQLLRHPSCTVHADAFKSLRQALYKRRREIRRNALGRQFPMNRIAETLQKASERIKKLPIRHNGWKAVKSGLGRSYQQSREAMAEALQNGSDEAMHEWRKRVKYQRHHLEILCSNCKEVMEPLARQTHKLADLLGQHHDLAVLKNLANGELNDALEHTQHAILLTLIAERQQKLQRKAAKLGRRLCGENKKVFVSRVHGYWRSRR
jgi:CHAD domain-containing protein